MMTERTTNERKTDCWNCQAFDTRCTGIYPCSRTSWDHQDRWRRSARHPARGRCRYRYCRRRAGIRIAPYSTWKNCGKIDWMRSATRLTEMNRPYRWSYQYCPCHPRHHCYHRHYFRRGYRHWHRRGCQHWRQHSLRRARLAFRGVSASAAASSAGRCFLWASRSGCGAPGCDTVRSCC